MRSTSMQTESPPGWRDAVDAAATRHGDAPTQLLQILIETQEQLGWLSPDVIARLAERLSLSRAHIKGVAGFYSFLHTVPMGRYRVLFADNIIERMQGGPELMAALCRKLWLEPGKVSEDGLVSVDVTSCTGMSDQGPALLVNGRAIPQLTHKRIEQIGDLIRGEVPLQDWPAEFFGVEDNIRRRDLILNAPAPKGEALLHALALGPERWLDRMKRSRLRGRGGAAFSTATKWELCRQAPVGDLGRVVVCNADEGEPGTFKDRVLLSSCPDLVIEGLTLAAFATGAKNGFIYLRGEYRYLRDHLENVLARRRKDNLLGQNILDVTDFNFDVEIHMGAGAYICGEETSLLESLEGKRGTPRLKPPYPVTSGYLGRPTAVNNVETLAAASVIALQGAEGWAALGTEPSSGTKILSVSGDCLRPGVYEFPLGVTVREVLDACGARDVQAVQVNGAAGVAMTPPDFDRRICFSDAPTAGAVMVFNQDRDMFEVARNFVQFFKHESCGFCTPCRVGTSLLCGYLDKLQDGHGSRLDMAEIEQLNKVLKSASHCALGQSAANPVLDGLKKFRPAYDRRLGAHGFEPAFNLDGALARARQVVGRDDAAAHLSQQE